MSEFGSLFDNDLNAMTNGRATEEFNLDDLRAAMEKLNALGPIRPLKIAFTRDAYEMWRATYGTVKGAVGEWWYGTVLVFDTVMLAGLFAFSENDGKSDIFVMWLEDGRLCCGQPAGTKGNHNAVAGVFYRMSDDNVRGGDQ